MTLNIKDGLVQIDETIENKITDFNLNRGFAMLSAFRSEYTLEQNCNYNKQLASRLKFLGYYFIKITGYYTKNIGPNNSILIESFLVPVYDIKTKASVDFDTFKSDMAGLGKKFKQDSVLVTPPTDQDSITIASATNAFFSMKEKTLNEARSHSNTSGIKFESVWLDEPAHTVSGVRIRTERNELPPFGSHYYSNSRIYNLTTLK